MKPNSKLAETEAICAVQSDIDEIKTLLYSLEALQGLTHTTLEEISKRYSVDVKHLWRAVIEYNGLSEELNYVEN